jgi:DNA processing protein
VTQPERAAFRLTDAQRLAWLRLIRSENVGARTFRSLLNHFGGAAAALEALPALGNRGGARREIRVCSLRDAERELDGLARLGGRMVALGEADYPEALAHADGAPPLLSVLGRSEVARRPMVAIVGARNASAAGRTFAQRLARALGEAGFVVASGLARGVDGAAHEGALATGTVAALAGGVDRIYPPEHTDLLARMLEVGAAYSEMPLGWVARAQDFPRRNRIIAGLSRGIVVVEAALRSGSLITARLAGELGREVMCAPGSPIDPRCEGSNRLLRDGATLITCADHVIEALAPGIELPPGPPLLPLGEGGDDERPRTAEALPDERARILELLGPSPAGIDEIVRMSGASARAVQLVLLELELAGRLERHGGSTVSLRL